MRTSSLISECPSAVHRFVDLTEKVNGLPAMKPA